MIRPDMKLSEFLLRFEGAHELLDDFDIHFEPDFDAEATLEELCDESNIDYWEIEEELLLLDERRQGWDEAM